MGLRVVWADPAREALGEILDYIGAEDPAVPGPLVGRVDEALRKAAGHPEMYRYVPELGHTYREIVTVRPFRVVYRIEARELRVIAVMRCEQEFDPRRFV